MVNSAQDLFRLASSEPDASASDRPTTGALLAIENEIRSASTQRVIAFAASARIHFWQHVLGQAFFPQSSLPDSLVARIPPEHRTSFACVLSIHRNGYVRELGVRHLITLAPSEEATVAIPFLALRCDDIVTSIRYLAEDALMGFLKPPCALGFGRALPLICGLAQRVRGGQSPMLSRVTAFFGSSDAHIVRALEETIRAEDAQTRLEAFVMMLQSRRAFALKNALQDPSTRIRVWAARHVVTSEPSVQDVLLPIMKKSPLPLVRLLALRVHHRRRDGDAPFEVALLDESSAVRLEARLTLRKRHPERAFGAARALALRTIGASNEVTSAEIVGALGALSDTGLSDDCAALEKFLTHAVKRVRDEAKRTVGMLTPSA